MKKGKILLIITSLLAFIFCSSLVFSDESQEELKEKRVTCCLQYATGVTKTANKENDKDFFAEKFNQCFTSKKLLKKVMENCN